MLALGLNLGLRISTVHLGLRQLFISKPHMRPRRVCLGPLDAGLGLVEAIDRGEFPGEDAIGKGPVAAAEVEHACSAVEAQLPADIDGDAPQPAIDMVFDRAAGEHRLAVAERAGLFPVGFGVAVHSCAYRGAEASGGGDLPR